MALDKAGGPVDRAGSQARRVLVWGFRLRRHFQTELHIEIEAYLDCIHPVFPFPHVGLRYLDIEWPLPPMMTSTLSGKALYMKEICDPPDLTTWLEKGRCVRSVITHMGSLATILL